MDDRDLFQQIFQLKLTVKQLERASKKAAKESEKKKKKVLEYIRKGNAEVARLYANDSIRKKNESLSFLRLASRLEGVRSRLETLQANKNVAISIAKINREMEKTMQTMDVQKVAKLAEAFEKNFENLDVVTDVVDNKIDVTTATLIPPDQVDELIRQVADEYSLELHTLLPEIAQGSKVVANNQPQEVSKHEKKTNQQLEL
jgi:charged multivesicular body protein 1